VPLLAACGDDGGGTGNDSAGSSTPGSSEPTESGAPGSADGLATTSDIEVGGGKIFTDQNVVITQPTEGAFVAFAATCTHQGCPFESVSDGTINCGCHGSKFSIEDGSNVEGPSGSEAGSVDDLEEVAITVSGDQISLG
jgi:nitrite reductase/ring-hydroxylating ferredoxin subunit